MVDFVLFGTSQRCGSTLLQRIFNLNHDNFMWGENGRLLLHFHRADINLKTFSNFGPELREQYLSSNRSSDVFIANINPDYKTFKTALNKGYKTIFDMAYASDKYKKVGFKEVGSVESINLLRELYPEIDIYFCARNPFDCWRSLWNWGHQVENWIETWYQNTVLALTYEHSKDFFWYEDVLSDVQTRTKIANYAGVDLKQVNQLIDNVGRIGSTKDKIKEDMPSEHFKKIEKYLLAQKNSDQKKIILNICKRAGYIVTNEQEARSCK